MNTKVRGIPEEREIVKKLDKNIVKEMLEKVEEDKRKLPSILGFSGEEYSR